MALINHISDGAEAAPVSVFEQSSLGDFNVQPRVGTIVLSCFRNLQDTPGSPIIGEEMVLVFSWQRYGLDIFLMSYNA